MSDQHPTVPSWTPEPPPPPARRRLLGPGLLAGLIAAVVLFGGVGLFAARQTAATGAGAGSPEAAASGLVDALASQDLGRAARYLDSEEALLVTTYGARVTDVLAKQVVAPTSPNGKPMTGVQLTARDVRFQRVAGLGGDDVGVVELAGGTLGARDAQGVKLELPAADVNRRLSDQSKGAVRALRLVTIRSGDRWRVSLLASVAEQARLAAGAAEPDWNQLAATGQPAPGAASPEAAVRDLVAAVGRGQQDALQQLSPAERRVLAAYRPLLDRPELQPPAAGPVRVEGLETRTEPVAADVARVHATAGRLLAPRLERPLDLDQAVAKGEAPYVVTIRQDGTWYPSLVFSVTDWMLTRAEREHP